MGEYGAMLTMQDLVDLVTFLQSSNQSNMPKPREPEWGTSPLGSRSLQRYVAQRARLR